MDVIAAEYPGYGLYTSDEPSEKTIVEDATLIVQHCIQNLKYKEENIILIGRSLGTGVALQIGSIYRKIRAIILISAFLSIRYVGENLAGTTLSKFLPNVFRNEEVIPLIRSPVLFIHGMNDTLVPWTASQTLYIKCLATKELYLGPSMDHNKMDFKNDIIMPIIKFFSGKLGMKGFESVGEKPGISKLDLLTEMDDFPYLCFPFIDPSKGEETDEPSAKTTRSKRSGSMIATEGDLRFDDV